MRFQDFLSNCGLSSLKINVGFLEGEFSPGNADKAAAWDLYIELLTRVTTQWLRPEDGEEQAALDSVHEIFPLTREILKRHGPGAGDFAKLVIPTLNQIIRPFAASWHRRSLAEHFSEPVECQKFREELLLLQSDLRSFSQALAAMAGVEDLTKLEDRI